MKKNLHYFVYSLIAVFFIIIINIFFKIFTTNTQLIGINIVILLNIIIVAICSITSNILLKKYNLENLKNNSNEYSKNFREDLANRISNSFFINSIISISLAILIYGFLKNVLLLLKLPNGIINYTVYASKIWFISSPFIGLEITILKYFSEIKYFKIPYILLFSKFVTFIVLSFFLYFKYKNSCMIYAKPISDIIFLFYYSKVCFEITLKNKNKIF